jgi:hypothetical protein
MIQMERRHFTKAMGAVVAGMAAGTRVFAEEKQAPPKTEAKAEDKDTHICKGMNDCKGKGGCASDAAKHACKGKNECKGMGGCAAGAAGCAGKNECKGKGGCAVPVNKAHITGDKAGKHACKGKGGCKGR